MSQIITEDLAADLIATITNQAAQPALGLLYTDVTVEYKKETDASFSAKSLAPTAGSVTSGNAETYTLVDGQTLTVAVDGGGAQTATFNTADFADIANATAAEVAAVITTDITGATASDSSGSVLIVSDTTGETSTIQVTGGTANTALGFSTALQTGSTFWKEIGSGVYTIEFTATELDTPGIFVYKVTGATIEQFVGTATIQVAGNTQTLVALNTCIITGHVFDLSGNPVQGAAVSARVLGFPTIDSSAALTDRLVSVTTDANGEFFLPLARLVQVTIQIPSANYTRQLTVPNQATVNLYSIA